MECGVLSLLVPLVAIILAFVTRQILISMFFGIIVGGIILKGNFLAGISEGVNSIVYILKEEWASKSILFCLLIGSMVYVLEVSGGIQGLVILLTEKTKVVKSKIGSQLIAYLIGFLLFVEATSSVVISGTVARPFFDKYKVSREKLAYICDSTASPIAWLFPINAAGTFIMAQVAAQNSKGIISGEPFMYVLSAIPFQFYSIVAVVVVGIVIFTGRDFSLMKKAEERTQNSSDVIAEAAAEMLHYEILQGKKPRAVNMILPIAILVGNIIFFLYSTGGGNITKGDGPSAIYQGIIITLFITGIFYWIQGYVKPAEYIKWCIKGMNKFLEITIILILAFTLGSVMNKLGTGLYLAQVMNGNVAYYLVPALMFIIGSIISFSTGTSVGTVSIIFPIAVPVAASLGTNIPLTIGAVVSSAIFGDHCSPISDSTILSSMIAEIPVMEHFKTQIPYALVSGGISLIMFLVAGFIF
ncbi:sodium:proton antiporter [Clostridium aestuarii]|uniref:Sodium:proton antiporter n=1 Tax=Clostridium aestuarii TaxID=338193 RepID=A0ABT4CVM1_9CLOT|nr:Na+/H+ antiporter NhaC family protein [Clostridium aestuarii]MCY6483034.1 sodium:proton antiporter [Clostridium aestuarii]